MIILGLNISHDASAALLINGKLVGAIEEEKLSRIKQDKGYPKQAIRELLVANSISPDQIDIIALDREVLRSYSERELRYRFSKTRGNRFLELVGRVTSYFLHINRVSETRNEELIKSTFISLGYTKAQICFMDHHQGHAYSVVSTSPISLDLIVTADGRGGLDAFNFYTKSDRGLKLLSTGDYTSSVGAFYSAITELLGFRPNRHEGKITGLAAFGKFTDLVTNFRELFDFDESQGVLKRYPFDEIGVLWDTYKNRKKITLTRKINLSKSSGLIAEDFTKRNILLLSRLEKLTEGYSIEDIAYACQVVTEEIVCRRIEHIIKTQNLGYINIGLAGGVFANVRINQKIYELDVVENIYVHPAMGDAGLALGFAFMAGEQRGLFKINPFKHSYFGADYTAEFEAFGKDFKNEQIECLRLSNPSETIAELLVQNKIIGFMANTPMEWGPRALGSRSILVNTFDRDVNKTLNDRLNRTEFMPFAPVVLDKVAKEYFPAYDDKVPAGTFMTITYDTDKKYHEMLQAVVHVDGTARPQVITREQNSEYYNVLEKFYQKTNCGALVNTSFNAHEEPILNSPEAGIRALMSNRVDFLVMGHYLYSFKK